jgi:hypothetical protein
MVILGGRELGNEGRVTVLLPDDDPDAFLIILNVVHSRHRQLPGKVSLEMLTRISVLVDKYQMVEAVEVFSSGWIARFKLPDYGHRYHRTINSDSDSDSDPHDSLDLP